MTPRTPSLAPTDPPIRSTLVGPSRRVVTTVVSVVLSVAGPLPVLAAGPADVDADSQLDVETLLRRGQAAFDVGDYQGAIEAWGQILDVLPENDRNREERENALLIVMAAYEAELRERTALAPATDADLDRLREALALCDAYTEELTRVHGPSAVGAAVLEARLEIEQKLGLVSSTPGASSTPDGPIICVRPKPGPEGIGTIVAGASTMAVGLGGMMPLVVIGARREAEADQDIADAEAIGDSQAVREAEDRKRSANTMLVTGAVLMGVVTVGGAVVLALGTRRRLRAIAFTPVVGPAFVGATLRRRF